MTYAKLQNGSDIRGIALEGVDGEAVNLTDEAVYDLARAFATWLSKKTGKKQLRIAVGRDSRLSGQKLQHAITDGLLFDGAQIFDCGMATTPAMFMACVFPQTDCDGSIMITASHLPWNRNGMKFFDKEGGLESHQIKELIEIADTGRFERAAEGSMQKCDLMALYATHLKNMIKEAIQAADYAHPLKDLHIVVDAGNGAGGFFATDVLGPLGADISGSQFLEPDGSFPNHIPNPENKEAMASVCRAVLENKADLGLIFDTDVDRSSAVDEFGNPISRNAIIALAALIAKNDHPATTIVTDSVTSDELHAFLESHGMKHVRFKRGYKNVINEAKRLNENGIDCQLAIETSGHAAYKNNYFLDDGAYLATRIVIEAVKDKLSTRLADLKHPLEEGEFRLPIDGDDFIEYGNAVIERLTRKAADTPFIQAADSNFEGIRLNFDSGHGNGWLLVRMSLHDPILPCNIESNTPGGVKQIKQWLDQALRDETRLDRAILE